MFSVLAVILLIAVSCAQETATPDPTTLPPTSTITLSPTTASPTSTPPPPTSEPDEQEEEPTPIPPTPTSEPTPTPAASAQYRLVFDATWSAESHPVDFPSNPHFSGLIGAVHKPTIPVWESGVPASPGIRRMAETGAKSPLNDEINDLIVRGGACDLISGDGIGRSPGTAEVVFTANQVCPAVSVVTMIAPSPDWFVGVSALNLLQDGVWVDELVVDLLPWDAGTDSGESYASANDATNPLEVIFQIDSEPLLIDGTVPSLGTFTFTRVGE